MSRPQRNSRAREADGSDAMDSCPVEYVPVPPAELDALGLRCAAGDRSVEDRIFKGVAALIWKILRAIASENPTLKRYMNDMFSEACIATVKAMRSYGGQIPLASWIGLYVSRHMIHRKQKITNLISPPQGKKIAYSEHPAFRPAVCLHEGATSLAQPGDGALGAVDAALDVKTIMDKLPEDARLFLIAAYEHGMSNADVGRIFGVRRQFVRRYHQKVLNAAREVLAEV